MTATRADVVVDASAAVRALTKEGPAAELFDELAAGGGIGHAPMLAVAEVSNALSLGVRAEQRALEDAQALLRSFIESPIVLHEMGPLAPAALELVANSQLSAYDAFYAVLARALEIPLVTADRRLAAAVPDSVLVA